MKYIQQFKSSNRIHSHIFGVWGAFGTLANGGHSHSFNLNVLNVNFPKIFIK